MPQPSRPVVTPDRFTVQIRWWDVLLGKRRSFTRCPLARALHRELGAGPFVWVTAYAAEVCDMTRERWIARDNGTGVREYDHDGSDFVEVFDRLGPLHALRMPRTITFTRV